jgi:hypothetical protein
MLALPPAPANPWYDSTGFGTLIAVIIGIVIIYLTLRLIPKRRLYYGTDLITSLLTAPSDAKGSLELRYKNTVLTNPYIVRTNIMFRGRQDIASEDYDNARPLDLNLGSQIIELLEVESKPTTALVPSVKYKDTSLQVGPSLMVSGQKVIITALVDGGRPTLNITSPLKNVRLRRAKENAQDMNMLLAGPQSAAAIGVVAGLAAFYIQQFSPHPLNYIAGWLSVVLLFAAAACQIWMIITVALRQISLRARLKG